MLLSCVGNIRYDFSFLCVICSDFYVHKYPPSSEDIQLFVVYGALYR